MKYKIEIGSESGINYLANIDSPKACPVCNCTLDPKLINNAFFDSEEYRKFSINFHCRNCSSVFMSKYITNLLSSVSPSSTNLIKSIPITFHERKFPKSIYDVSSKFHIIYNQSFQAEQEGLIEICGAGYRKALEFLVKDFIKHKHPEIEIEKLPLSQCIEHYIESVDVKTIVKACTWLANDEVHYFQKWSNEFIDNQDKIEQIKRFIDVFISHVEMVYQIKQAQSILEKSNG